MTVPSPGRDAPDAKSSDQGKPSSREEPFTDGRTRMKSGPDTDIPCQGVLGKNGPRAARPRVDLLRRRRAREFFLALRRGLNLGHCRSCETFYLMAKLCRDECGDAIAPAELAEVESWVEGGSLLDLGFGCEGACAIVASYSRIAG